ncbi:hypothetical protein AB0C96_36735 [Streptomyces sp. NPDC048506]|uniref:hypothetical protein n=1 Tax=Streptomyces sp. NPDC048506 TaxID=3155028 RepID=UPI00343A9ACD
MSSAPGAPWPGIRTKPPPRSLWWGSQRRSSHGQGAGSADTCLVASADTGRPPLVPPFREAGHVPLAPVPTVLAADVVRLEQAAVRALDAIDDTPVLDIKPYMTEFGPQGTVTQPPWTTEIMHHYY